MIKISILIPTYKRPELLMEAVKSCLAQTYAPYEVIIGDDSPDFLTKVVVTRLKRESLIPIRYIHNQPSLKQASNVNMLFKEASGDKIMLLHDDDLLMPESLETLVNVFERDKSVQIAFGKQYIITDSGEIDYPSSETFNRDFYRESKYAGSVLTPYEAGLGQQFPNNGYVMDAQIAKSVQWRSEAGDACDYDFGYQLGVAGYKMHFVDKYLGKYRLSSSSISLLKANDSAYQAYKIINSSVANSPMAKEIRAKRLFERAPIAITGAVNMGRRKEAIAILFSEWYRNRLLSLRGLKRILYVFFFFDADAVLRRIAHVRTTWFRRSLPSRG